LEIFVIFTLHVGKGFELKKIVRCCFPCLDMPKRQQAADYFESESTTEQPVVKSTVEVVVESGKLTELRRSGRLQSSSVEPSSSSTTRRTVLEMGQAAKKMSPHIAKATPVSARTKTRTLSGESNSTDEIFVDASEDPIATPSVAQVVDISVDKSPVTEDQYVSAMEDAADIVPSGEGQVILDSLESADIVPGSEGEDVSSDASTTRVTTTQNTLEDIPSSQPRPRSQRTPLPLQPIPSSAPPSLPTSTDASPTKSTSQSTAIPLDEDTPESSDDEAPEAISLSKSRTEALQSQSQITQSQKAHASKIREKRRARDTLLATQKATKRSKTEIPDSQPTEVSMSGNTTDTPAPNQDHQAARVARHVDALPTSILQAASATWLDPAPVAKEAKKPSKKRKARDDGVTILGDMNTRLAPKAGKIAGQKERLIMRLGRGDRRMFVGRFAR
jgi:hypothetical protein